MTKAFAEWAHDLVKDWPPLTESQVASVVQVLRAGAGRAVPRMDNVANPQRERTALYRHFDKDGALLYVGISNNPPIRRGSHQRHSAFMRFAVRETIEWFDTRPEALAAESAAIESERPLFNKVGSSDDRDEKLVEYIIARGAFDLLAVAG